MALDPGPASRRTPVRAALGGAAVGIAGLVAGVVFAASLAGLVSDPVRQGWNWDAIIGNPNAQVATAGQYAVALHKNADVAAFTPLGQERYRVAGQAVTVFSIGTGRGLVAPPVLEGRMPAANDEIALGDDTMRSAHAFLGQRVAVAGAAGRVHARVVGRVLLPAAAAAGFNLGTDLRRGAVMTERGVEALGGDAVTPPHLVAVRLAPGVAHDRAIAALRRQFGSVVLASPHNVNVTNLQRIRTLPAAFGLLLGLFALVSIGFGVYATGTRRRRDLALYRTFGFSRRQLAGTVSAQGTILAIAAALVGIPAGIILGRLLWIAVATSVADVDPRPVVPGLTLFAGTVAGLVLVNLIAVRSAVRAAHVHPGTELRAE